MATYKELLAEREKLEKQISEARKAEVGEAVAKIRALMKDFDLSIKDIEPNRAADKREKVEPKFRDPATGATWTGRGKPPAWIKDKNREDFAIKS
ncbi:MULTISPECIES: H-NS family nucleoid-associated regulatory protein [Pseudomonadota]|jgi:DNA-binding protein H-NS|uniref:H-NS histone family protein n=2 Tax=Comamonas TaxID=283 RepID=A0AA42Q8E1_9BURK|nr:MULTISPECIES: H-NS histone family protein [Pseudomonadota]MCN9483537.1 H-NS histone family protein [Pseudomonas aeruginosa]MCN9559010.1 H-NS histone family protein [Pseudomonas aeruginosa]MCR4145928.1 H-NS histone family protein [Alcaligenes faecalis]MDE5214023.1 H-NS histone family protein [Pseudomonas aeruginosa]MDE5228324.1 H-NS histone family protein [Pseudomonas aeruginosa]